MTETTETDIKNHLVERAHLANLNWVTALSRY
jgi:hypothetical protein